MALHKTVDELLNSISSRELSEWMAYDNIEPFGEIRADMRAGAIVQAIIAPYVKKGHKVPKLQQCMLNFDNEEKKPMTSGEIKGFLMGCAPTKPKE